MTIDGIDTKPISDPLRIQIASIFPYASLWFYSFGCVSANRDQNSIELLASLLVWHFDSDLPRRLNNR